MSGDLIYREDALNALKGVIARTGLYGVAIEVILANLDPVEAEPVIHAYWDSQNRCSNCCVPAISHDIDEEVEAFYLTKRCPYCGAHMDEEVAE